MQSLSLAARTVLAHDPVQPGLERAATPLGGFEVTSVAVDSALNAVVGRMT
jgi:hypothetical protein